MKKIISRIISGLCVTSLIVTLFPVVPKVSAANWSDESVNQYIDAGGFKTELFGTGMYNWQSVPRSEKLPPSKVYLTDHYMETVGTVPTSDWASSVVFDQYSESLYAHPLAYRAASNGMQMATPAITVEKFPTDNEPQVTSLLKDDTVELVVGGEGFSAADAKVDKTTDWTYDVIMANAAGTSSMMITLAKGSPYAYYKFDNVTPTISLGAGATDMAIYKNSTSSNQIGISVLNKKDNKKHYYGIYAPEGTTWTNAGGKLTANLPAGKNYVSIATLSDDSDAAFSTYARYAYNYITDTIVEWNYNENASNVSTNYYFETTNQETGAVGGDTIMALYPHQWRYAQDESFAPYTYDTIRGKMKTIIGTNYTTNMTYNGILPVMPIPKSEEGIGTLKEQIGYYYGYYSGLSREPKWIDPGLDGANGGYDTYWIGKNYNRISDVIMMADLLDDNDPDMQAMKEEMMAEMEANLLYWFNPNEGYPKGENDYDSYFYYHAPYGTLIGYPSGFGSDFEMNDHHFHYGYWIKAAATLALMDKTGEWEQTNGGMVYEMIDDIANMNRSGESHSYEKTGTKYPFLRNFDIYEGHSWANGVSNYEYDANGNLVDAGGGLSGGNNQESSTESVNAWAAIILWGEAVGDKEIRDLGVYLYTTEVAAIEDYYYDVHGDIFPDGYVDANNFNLQSVTRLFGGRYDHSTWWTEDPIEATTINMLPMTGATLYLGKDKDKVKAVCDSIAVDSVQWTHYLQNPGTGLTDEYMHQDILGEYYALADPEGAMSRWSIEDVNGGPHIEFGDSRAHTYGYIQSMVEYGTPNYEITGSSPFSMVFEKDGKRTYVAYNYSEETENVYFSDGTYIEVQAGTQYTGAKTGDGENPEADDPSKVKYNTEYYVETANGTYELNATKKAQANPDTVVTAVQTEIPGYTFDAGNDSNVLSATVTTGNTVTLKLYYKRNSYTIQLEPNGGTLSSSSTISFKYGDNVALPIPVKSGVAFDGWYKDAALTQQITSTASVTENLTLYAKYYDPNVITGITLNTSDITLLAGNAYRLTATIIPETVTNKTVTWSSSDNSVASVSNGMITAVKAGTATITATASDASFTASCTVTVKQMSGEVQLDAVGVKKDANGNVILYIANQPTGAGFVGYFAQYATEAEANSVTLNALPGYNMTNNNGVWEYNAGQLDDSKYLAYAFNNGIQEIPKVIKISEISGASEQITTYTVSFNSDGGSSVTSQTVISGQKAYEPDAPTKSGMFFKGWQLNGADYDFSSAVTGDITLTAVWSTEEDEPYDPYDPVTYVVTFDSAGGSNVASQTVEEGQTANEPTAPSKDGYTFTGWTLNGTEYNFATAVTDNITLVATWKENSSVVDPVSYQVSFDSAGGTTIASQNVTEGNTATVPTAPSRDGYTFNGWMLNGAKYDFTTPVTANITLVASWKENSSTDNPGQPVYYTVTFDSAGGSSVASQTVKEGETVTLPTMPTREGYVFTGWTLNGTIYNFANAVTSDITLVANWMKDTTTDNPSTDIKVTSIVINGGNQTIYVAGTVDLSATVYPNNATNNAVTWSTTDTDIVIVHPETGLVTGLKKGTATIYAVATDGSNVTANCKITVTESSGSSSGNTDSGNKNTTTDKQYTVTFDSAGGSAVAVQNVKAGSLATAPAVPTRAGYTFAGWYNGGTLYNFNTEVTGNITLTASWTVNKVSNIKITGISKKIAVNKKIKLTATVNDDALDKSVTWSIDKPKYATVSQSGVVKMKKAGKNKTVKVTATANDGSGVSETYSIRIMQWAVKKITLTGKKSVKAGSKVNLKAKVSPIVSKKKMNKDLQWTSSNPEWATVTKKGVVQTLKAGKGKTVKITAKATDGSNKKKTIKIKIK